MIEPGSSDNFRTLWLTPSSFPLRPLNLSSSSLAGGSYALTVYQIGDDVVPPTPAPTPEVEEGDYGELGCAQDFADDGRVRDSDRSAIFSAIQREYSVNAARHEKRLSIVLGARMARRGDGRILTNILPSRVR